MQYILFEDESRFELQPLTFTRTVAQLRVGIDTLADKWHRVLPLKPVLVAWGFVGEAFNSYAPGPAILLNAKFIAEEAWVKQMLGELIPNTYFENEMGELVAAYLEKGLSDNCAEIITPEILEECGVTHCIKIDTSGVLAIRKPTDIFQLNKQCIEKDFSFYADKSAAISDPHTIVYGSDNIFVAEGVKIKAAILNAEDGPIYLGPGSEIQEGAIIHGAHAICENAVVNMGAKLRGDSTIGPWSKVGGEVSNSVLIGYSNKGHDGFLGNSVVGEWCNLGADTNTSNLKNNYSPVRLWNYHTGRFDKMDTMFCGLIMGDHSKCGINTMFNTATIIGVGANIFGAGYPRTFIPSFSWGGPAGMSTNKLEKAYEVADIVMSRRNISLSPGDRKLMEAVFEATRKYRAWEAKELS